MADPGFPVGGGGAPTRWGGANLQHIHFSVKTYAKTKEIDPVGGGAPAAPPGSANADGDILMGILFQWSKYWATNEKEK